MLEGSLCLLHDKVADLDGLVRVVGDEEVARLEVAVDDAAGVQEVDLKCSGNGGEESRKGSCNGG